MRHLLNQTSGLSTRSGWIPLADFYDQPDAIERQVCALSTAELAHPVGSAFEYSDSNYNVLGLIVEAVGGEPYTDYVQSHIFDPLEMRHSVTSRTRAKEDGLAMGHRLWFWFPVAAPDFPAPQGSLPSGQLISSGEDMAHYLIALLNGGRYGDAQILSEAGIAEMHQGVAEHVAMGMSMGTYGMGWYASDVGETEVIWHTGLVPDFCAYMALVPEQKKGVILLLNADHFMMEAVLTEDGAGDPALDWQPHVQDPGALSNYNEPHAVLFWRDYDEELKAGEPLVGYLTTTVVSPEAREAVLEFRTTGAAEILLNGEPVPVEPHPDEAHLRPRFRSAYRTEPLTLRAGKNVLLIRSAPSEEEKLYWWYFGARFVDEDGELMLDLDFRE